MPLLTHQIQPVNVSNVKVRSSEPNELECISNATLANVMRQLTDLGNASVRIFGELTRDAARLHTRTSAFGARLVDLRAKLRDAELKLNDSDDNDESEDGHEPEEDREPDVMANLTEKFRTRYRVEHTVCTRDNMSEHLRMLYEQAEKPPDFAQFDALRTDANHSMHFYSNPEYYYERLQAQIRRQRGKKKIKVNNQL